MLLALAAALLAQPAGPAPAVADAPEADPAAYAVEVVAEGLAQPYDVTFLTGGEADGDILVTERPGRVRVLRGGAVLDLAGVPEVHTGGQAGLFEAFPHPGFAQNGLLYLTYAVGPRSASTLALGRGRYVVTEDGATLEDFRELFRADAARPSDAHYGGRAAWLPDGTLLLTSGEAYGQRLRAQDLGSHLGKVLRLTDEGQPAPGNPFAGREGALPEIYSLGHRNPQGIVRVGTRVFANEHGPRGGDELNLVEAGANYGWPGVSYGLDYSGALITPFATWEGTEQPLVQWTPSIAPSALAYYDGLMFPRWRGQLLTSALAHKHVRLVDPADPTRQQTLFAELGMRVRDVSVAPDGAVWLALETKTGDGGRVVRVTPGRGD